MKHEDAERNILLYIMFKALAHPWFWGPIIFAYIEKMTGMTMAEIYIMEAAGLFLLVIAEIGAGTLADTIGRKRTVLIGCTLLIVGTVGFACISTTLGVWVQNIVWMIGFGFVSGADDAVEPSR